MKRKRFDHRNWHRVLSGQQTLHPLPGGLVVDYVAGEVIKPLEVNFRGRMLRILDSGYRWVYYAPHGKRHALTVQLDHSGVPQQLYVDIGAGQGLDSDGQPWIDDLYLDVIAVCEVEADGFWRVTETEIIDQEELEDALREGEVAAEQAALAWQEARAVEAALTAQTFQPLEVVRGYLAGSGR